MSSFWWNPTPLTRAVQQWKRDGLRDASRHLRGAIRLRIAIQGVPVSRRSLPGEAPRYESRDLIKSWSYFVVPAGAYAIVYSSLDYSYYLEVFPGVNATYGFIHQRPYIRVSLLAEEAILAQILTRPLPP